MTSGGGALATGVLAAGSLLTSPKAGPSPPKPHQWASTTESRAAQWCCLSRATLHAVQTPGLKLGTSPAALFARADGHTSSLIVPESRSTALALSGLVQLRHSQDGNFIPDGFSGDFPTHPRFDHERSRFSGWFSAPQHSAAAAPRLLSRATAPRWQDGSPCVQDGGGSRLCALAEPIHSGGECVLPEGCMS